MGSEHESPVLRRPQNAAERLLLFLLGGISAARVGLGCGLVALIVYVATCAPGVYWQDSGVHQYRILNGLAENPLGLALSHPLHFHICRTAIAVWPGEPAYAMNLVSALGGAAGVGLLAGVVFALTRMLTPALLAGGVLLVAHTYWQMSVVTETYTLAAALMAAEWCVLLQYARNRRPDWLVLLLGVNGLHIANHLLGALTFITYAALLLIALYRGRARLLHAAAAAVAWLLAALPYLMLIAGHYARTGDLPATLYSALFGSGASGRGYAAEVLNASLSWRLLANALLYWAYNFPAATILVALYGVWHLRAARLNLFWRVIAVQTAVIFLFVMRYSIRDQITFYVPVCALTALWFGYGAGRALRVAARRERGAAAALALWSCLVLPPLVYAAFPELARSRGWLAGQLRAIPYREPYAHFLTPWKQGDDSAAQFARAALRQAGPGGWFFGNLTVGGMTGYTAQRPGAPAGARVFSYRDSLTPPGAAALTNAEILDQLRRGGAIVVAPFDDLARYWEESGEFTVERDGTFWRLRPVQAPPPTEEPAARTSAWRAAD